VRSWLAKKLLSRLMGRLNAGDPEPLLRLDHRDVRFRFPGDSSWAADLRGKDELRRWLQRFAASGVQIFADEVVVRGWPWSTTLAIRGTDHLITPDGERVYANRYVIWGRVRWGLLREYEVYEDTQASKALDDHVPALVAS
jgi:ketosteroid isomerase-like protein